MKRPFREHHVLTILYDYEQQTLPLDHFVGNYYRANKALGSKDRSFIAETVYAIIRWKGLLDFACNPSLTWESRLDLFLSSQFAELQKQQDIPDHVRVSFPRVLFDEIVASHGLANAIEICSISNSPAPTTVRVNALKTTREAMLDKWNEEYSPVPCQFAPYGVSFPKRLNFALMPEFREGFFEIQDEGSQLLAQLMKVQPGQLVMDYCSGAGGKTLAFAPLMNKTGQIYLHDIRKNALQDCRKRLRKAGIQNAQIIHAEDPKLKKLKKNMDWVLVDAPCTGTGTMRRNPDMKWKFDEAMLTRLTGLQRVIFERALSYLKPGGYIVYATCSLLKQENSHQIAHFMKTYNLECVGEAFQSFPIANGMDGFFGVILKNKE